MNATTRLVRHSAGERLNHWLVAICFMLAALSGLPFFHPAFFWLTNLFGGSTWARILHPFFGCLAAILFLMLTIRIWKDNRITAVDWQWARHMGAILQNKTGDLPALGKYNFGQKMLTKTLLAVIVLLFGSGLFIWQPYFAQEFTVHLRRQAVLVHALAAFTGVMGVIVHIYAAYWTRGSIRSMTQGTVTAAWAKHHHAGWYKEQISKTK